MLYCQAKLPSNGLGNRLFPWARCRIFSFLNNIPMLVPVWSQFKIGALLRKESDLRFYLNLFEKKSDYVAGIRRSWLQVAAGKEPEPESFGCPEVHNKSKHIILVYEGVRDCFCRLNGWDQFLLGEIRAITRRKWLSEADRIPSVPIGIHIRRGDFREARSKNDFYTTGSLRTPLSWFIKSLTVVREILGFSAKAYVVSNGTEEELKDILCLKNVIFFRSGSAIGDLLLLSKAKILLASGGSTFSAWASFFGQMPTISHPGQSLSWFKLINRKGYFLGEFNPDSPPQSFREQIKSVS